MNLDESADERAATINSSADRISTGGCLLNWGKLVKKKLSLAAIVTCGASWDVRAKIALRCSGYVCW